LAKPPGTNGVQATEGTIGKQVKADENKKKRLGEMKYPTAYDMLKRMKATGLLKIYACSPTMEMFGVKKEDLTPEVDQIAGVAAFLGLASTAETTILV